MIGELHDELLPDHARGAKNTDVYSAGNHCVLHLYCAEPGRTKVLRYRPACATRRAGLPRRSAEGDRSLTRRSAEGARPEPAAPKRRRRVGGQKKTRSEEHTSELQSQSNLVCRLLLEKKKKQKIKERHQNN